MISLRFSPTCTLLTVPVPVPSVDEALSFLTYAGTLLNFVTSVT